MTRITIDLPEPAHKVTQRGFKHLIDWDAIERSHADHPHVDVGDETMTVEEAEEFALAVLWLVREHYHGYGLQSEVKTEP